MRRAKQEITDKAEIYDIIRSAEICHLALCDGDVPYVIPLNFGFRDDTVYIHSAHEGRKIDIIEKNPNVCVEWTAESEVIVGKRACDYSAQYRSAIGTGRAFMVDAPKEKQEALGILMSHYSNEMFTFSDKEVATVSIIKVVLDTITAKRSK